MEINASSKNGTTPKIMAVILPKSRPDTKSVRINIAVAEKKNVQEKHIQDTARNL
jgi:hypothetical protein